METNSKAKPQFKLSRGNLERIEQTVNRALALIKAHDGKFKGEKVTAWVDDSSSALVIMANRVNPKIVFAGCPSKGGSWDNGNFEVISLELGFREASLDIDKAFEAMQAEATKKLKRR